MTTSSGAGRSLAWTMAVVATIAVDLAVLRAYFPAIPNPGLVLMALVLEVGLFRAVSRQGGARAFWVGFEISGWLYVMMCSLFARTAWRLIRSLFERAILGHPIAAPSEMNRFLLFSGILQFAISLSIALTVGLLTRWIWRRTRPALSKRMPVVEV